MGIFMTRLVLMPGASDPGDRIGPRLPERGPDQRTLTRQCVRRALHPYCGNGPDCISIRRLGESKPRTASAARQSHPLGWRREAQWTNRSILCCQALVGARIVAM